MTINGMEIKYKRVTLADIGAAVKLSDELRFDKILHASVDANKMDELKSKFAAFARIAIESPTNIDITLLSPDEIMELQTGFFMPRFTQTT